LRNRIFKLAIAGEFIRPKLSDTYLYKQRSYNPHYRGTPLHMSIYKPPLQQFSILRTCRQVYAETAILPFALSTFTFLCEHDIGYWLDSLSPRVLKFICHVQSLQFGEYFSNIKWKFNKARP
jgi:hypothetical protein